jgi:argininosuccinate lyase
MAKMWDARFSKAENPRVNDFNSSISFDSRMFREDIEGSVAHAGMLGRCGIISETDADLIISGLKDILSDLENGSLQIDPEAEDIHMFIEQVLTERIGDAGKKLHTARSRNDQVALDIRLYLSKEIEAVASLIEGLIKTIADIAEVNTDTVMPGYTHLQRAQPVTFAHYILAYAFMFMRDYDRLTETENRTRISPLGSGALATTTYPINRQMVADSLGFDGITQNSIDGVSDRDFLIEFAFDLSLIMMHLSRFSEEVILWSSSEFSYIELDDAYSTGSSIMPQKKNPDIAELVRGKTARIYGDLNTLLVMMKGLPLAYNKDMQEDKEAIFDAVDNSKMCLELFTSMIGTMKVNAGRMRKAAASGFINATDCADYLVKKGMPFRDAYKVSGKLVSYCIGKQTDFELLSLEEYRQFSQLFDSDVYAAVNLDNCVSRRNVPGGPSKASVENQLKLVKEFLGNE